MSAVAVAEPLVGAGLQHLHSLTGRAAVAVDDLSAPELVVLTEQVASAATALQALAIAAMTADAESAAAAPGGGDVLAPDPEFVPDEVGLLLRCSTAAAHRRCGRATQVMRHRALIDHWVTGVISPASAEVIAELLQDSEPADPVTYDLVLDAVDYATGHTPSQLRAWLGRRVIAADPAAADQQRRRAFAGRKLHYLPSADGMASLWAWLPAVQARQIYDTVNAVAQAAGTDDTRAIDQRRADAFVDLIVGRAAPPQVNIQVLAPLGALVGDQSQPAEVTGVGTLLPAELADLLTSPGTTPRLRPLLTDPDTGHLTAIGEDQYRPSTSLRRAVQARDLICRFPGCRRTAAAGGTDLDHTIPWPHGDTTATNLAVLCRRHHRLKHSPGWQVVLDPDGIMTWTTPTGKTFKTHPWTYTHPRARGPS